LGPLYLIYINDLPKITDNDVKVVLFADGTSMTVTNSDKWALQQHSTTHMAVITLSHLLTALPTYSTF